MESSSSESGGIGAGAVGKEEGSRVKLGFESHWEASEDEGFEEMGKRGNKGFGLWSSSPAVSADGSMARCYTSITWASVYRVVMRTR